MKRRKVLILLFGVIMISLFPENLIAQISIHAKDKTIREIIPIIEKESGYNIFYNHEIKGLDAKKTVDITNQSIDKTLGELFKQTGIFYQIKEDKQIVLSNTAIVPAIASKNQSKDADKIKGTVSSTDGETLIGVSVLNQTTKQGVITNLDGEFTIEATPNDILVFSYVGFTPQQIRPGDKKDLNIKLNSDIALDEVVIVGYGTQKKANLTGSVASVGMDKITGRSNPNILTSLQGQVPGVTIVTRPGQAPSINFRGAGNLGTSSPLYVIDGVIADADFFGNIDPNSIESMSFLKDAASSAIYGSRAAYGVVLVKTKDGSNGRVNVKYNGNIGIKQATYTPKVLSSEWYARLSNEAALNDNPDLKILPYSDEVIEKYRLGTDPDMYPNTNWYDLVLSNEAVVTQHSVSLSGGGKVKFNSTLGYTYDEGFTKGTDQNRFNFATNLSSEVTNWFKFRANVNFIQTNDDRPNGGVAYLRLLTTPSTYVAKHSNGEYGTIGNGMTASTVDMQRNPLRLLEEGGWQKRSRKNTIFSATGDFKLVENLMLTGEISYKIWDSKQKTYESGRPMLKHFQTGKAIPGTESISLMTYDWQETTRLTNNLLLNYNKTFGVHSISALLGTSYEQYQWVKNLSSRRNFPTNNLEDLNGGSNAPNDLGNEGGTKENQMMSYFGRVTYNYADKYLFEANFRRDGSSRFHPDYRWGNFPSFSAAWRINQENFMQDMLWVNNLKVRASWGKLGNINNVGDYDYFSTYNLKDDYNYNFENSAVIGIKEGKPANTTLSWEKVTISDLGVDFDFLDNKFGITFDYYDKKTTSILLSYNVAREIGVEAPSQNLGSLRNRGVELSVRYTDRIGDFQYSIAGNFSKNKNEILDLGDSDPIYDNDNRKIKKVGHSIGTFYGYKTDGLLTQEDIDSGNYVSTGIKPNAGDIKYVSLTGNKELTGADRTYLGSDAPDLTYGASLSVSYKNFDFSVAGQGVANAKVYFWQEQAWAFADFASPREFHLQRWTVDNPNPNAGYPRIYSRTNSHSTFNQYTSDFWLFSASYFRVKNMTLGYAVPTGITNRIGMSSLRIYGSIENLLTLRGDKRMKDFDPETLPGRGTNTRGTRTFSFGLNISF